MPHPKGTPHSPETKERIRASVAGRPKSAEHRQRISEGRRRFFETEQGEALRARLSDLNRGARHPQWKGESIKYEAAHYRVYAARGRPVRCEHCGTSDPARHLEWANVSGRYADPEDYIPLCKSCHNRHDGIAANLKRQPT